MAPQVKVNVSEGVLALTGASAAGYGSYSERYILPARAMPDKITASCVHGLLTGAPRRRCAAAPLRRCALAPHCASFSP